MNIDPTTFHLPIISSINPFFYLSIYVHFHPPSHILQFTHLFIHKSILLSTLYLSMYTSIHPPTSSHSPIFSFINPFFHLHQFWFIIQTFHKSIHLFILHIPHLFILHGPSLIYSFFMVHPSSIHSSWSIPHLFILHGPSPHLFIIWLSCSNTHKQYMYITFHR